MTLPVIGQAVNVISNDRCLKIHYTNLKKIFDRKFTLPGVMWIATQNLDQIGSAVLTLQKIDNQTINKDKDVIMVFLESKVI